MTILEKFTSSSLDTGDIGLMIDPSRSPTPFTPQGSQIIGWAGDDTHFCTITGYGDKIFVIQPHRPDFVHVLADSFPEFLGLVAACGGTKYLADAWILSRYEFQRRIDNKPRSHKQRSILKALRNSFHPEQINDPYSRLLRAHESADYSKLTFSDSLKEFAQVPDFSTDWQVRFGSDFVGRRSSGAPGKRIQLNHSLTWGHEDWRIPALYACKDGIVIDFLVEISARRIRNFLEKWEHLADTDLSPMQQLELEQDIPTELHASISLLLKGHVLAEEKSTREYWNPCGKNSRAARRILEHYGCDREQGWIFIRSSFRWYNKTKAPLHDLKLRLEPLPCRIPGFTIPDPNPGDVVSFTHPVTNTEHQLTVVSVENEGFDYNFLSDIPNYCELLQYTLEPELADTEFRLEDTAPCDQPRYGLSDATPDGAASIGIIGGSDGPTAFFYTPKTKTARHTAVSSLRYEPAGHITWQAVFKVILKEPLQTTLVK